MIVLNGIFSVLAAMALSFVVLHPSIREGLVIKLGLIVMILSMGASAAVLFDEMALAAALNTGLALRIGIVIVCIGYVLKYRKAKRGGGPTDFGSLTEHN